MNNTRKVEGIIYAKFNNHDKRGSILYANRKGLTVIDRPFKELLKETVIEEAVNNTINANVILNETEELELNLMCQAAIHENKLRIQRGEK